MTEKDFNEELSSKNLKSKVDLAFRILSNISLYATLFAISWAIVIAITSSSKFNNVNGLCICILLIIAFICFIALPWVKRLLLNPKISITFLIFTGIIGLLLIILSVILFSSGKELGKTMLNFIKVVIIACIQFFVMSRITNDYFKYKKDRISLQIIQCLCYAYFDFFLSTIIINVVFDGENLFSDFVYKKLFSTPFRQIFIVSIVVFIVSKLWFSIIEKRSRKLKLNLDYSDREIQENKNSTTSNTEVSQTQIQSQSIEERLQKLKTLYDMNLLSKEDYEKKKQSILNEL